MASKKKSAKQASKEFLQKVKTGKASQREIDSVANVASEQAAKIVRKELMKAKKEGKFGFGKETMARMGLTRIEEEKRKSDAEKNKKSMEKMDKKRNLKGGE